MNFWQQLPKPLIGLSPMDGVSDHPFRWITKKYGKPAIMYTEFTSVEGVCHGAEQLLKDFMYDESQRPIIGQIYGSTPEFFRQCALVLCELGFDGVDINMGCPAKNVAHSGAGAALIKTPKLAQEIIRATQVGIEQWQNGATVDDCENITIGITEKVKTLRGALPAAAQARRQIPVSVKTRVGYDQPVIHDWISNILEMNVSEITLHGRTLKQQYGGLANWDLIGEAATLAHQSNTLLLGNGDVKSMADAKQKITQYGLDGVLLGRATMGNPFVLLQDENAEKPSQELIWKMAIEHSRLFEKTYQDGPKYNFLPMRKHLGWYVHDIPNAAMIRQAIYKCNTSDEFIGVLKGFGFEVREDQP